MLEIYHTHTSLSTKIFVSTLQQLRNYSWQLKVETLKKLWIAIGKRVTG